MRFNYWSQSQGIYFYTSASTQKIKLCVNVTENLPFSYYSVCYSHRLHTRTNFLLYFQQIVFFRSYTCCYIQYRSTFLSLILSSLVFNLIVMFVNSMASNYSTCIRNVACNPSNLNVYSGNYLPALGDADSYNYLCTEYSQSGEFESDSQYFYCCVMLCDRATVYNPIPIFIRSLLVCATCWIVCCWLP